MPRRRTKPKRKKLTPAQRSEIARQNALKRWRNPDASRIKKVAFEAGEKGNLHDSNANLQKLEQLELHTIKDPRHLIVISEYLATGSATKAGVKAGFGVERGTGHVIKPTAYRSARRILDKYGITKQLLAEAHGLHLGKIMETVASGLSAHKVITHKLRAGKDREILETVELPDHGVRLKAAEMALRLHDDANQQTQGIEEHQWFERISETLDHIRANTARNARPATAAADSQAQTRSEIHTPAEDPDQPPFDP